MFYFYVSLKTVWLCSILMLPLGLCPWATRNVARRPAVHGIRAIKAEVQPASPAAAGSPAGKRALGVTARHTPRHLLGALLCAPVLMVFTSTAAGLTSV